MAGSRTEILRAVDSAVALQEAELVDARTRQMLAVVTKTGTGTGNIDQTFSLDQQFRLVFLRCHFSGNSGTSAMTLALASASGSAYDTRLFTITRAGTNRDVNFRIPAPESEEPSPWSFRASDGVRIQWTNPDSGNITWGLEVGLSLASS